MSYIKKNINKIAEEEWNEMWKKLNKNNNTASFSLNLNQKQSQKSLNKQKDSPFQPLHKSS